KAAAEKGIKRIAFPPMGAGFYGIPLPLCAEIMLNTMKGYLEQNDSFDEFVICVKDNREYEPFLKKLETMN
ncbi:MAG: macro domain-containing protein, partial [bacterium]